MKKSWSHWECISWKKIVSLLFCLSLNDKKASKVHRNKWIVGSNRCFRSILARLRASSWLSGSCSSSSHRIRGQLFCEAVPQTLGFSLLLYEDNEVDCVDCGMLRTKFHRIAPAWFASCTACCSACLLFCYAAACFQVLSVAMQVRYMLAFSDFHCFLHL